MNAAFAAGAADRNHYLLFYHSLIIFPKTDILL